MKGVDSVKIDFKKKIAEVTMKDGASMTAKDALKAFKGSRYGVKKFGKKKS
jgi:hypothetical protein